MYQVATKELAYCVPVVPHLGGCTREAQLVGYVFVPPTFVGSLFVVSIELWLKLFPQFFFHFISPAKLSCNNMMRGLEKISRP